MARPNPIGLSVCQVEGVTDECLLLSCMDMVDGTPVLDVKPYIPYDLVPSTLPLPMMLSAASLRPLAVPAWINDADIPLRRVAFTGTALEGLRSVLGKPLLGKSAIDFEGAMGLINEVLAQDIRGIHQGRGAVDEALYECRLDRMRIRFSTSDECILVQDVAESESNHSPT